MKGFFRIFQAAQVLINLALVIQDARLVIRQARGQRDRRNTGREDLLGAADSPKQLDLSLVCLCPVPGCVLVLIDQGVECLDRVFRLALLHGNLGQAALDVHHHPRIGRLEGQYFVISFICFLQSIQALVNLPLAVNDARHEVMLIGDLRDRLLTGLESLLAAAGRSQHIDLSLVRLCPVMGNVLVLFDHPVDRRQGLVHIALAQGDIGQTSFYFRQHLGVGRLELQNPGKGFFCFFQAAEAVVNLTLVINDARPGVWLRNL